MNWTEWNERIGSKLVDRAFLIARRDGIEPGSALAIESLIRQARAELSREAGIDPYEPVTLDCRQPGDPLAVGCTHSVGEDCMICSKCGRCRETLDEDDICDECRGVLRKCYQPKTGQPCSCKRGIERDNCAACEGTGMRIDFARIRGTR